MDRVRRDLNSYQLKRRRKDAIAAAHKHEPKKHKRWRPEP